MTSDPAGLVDLIAGRVTPTALAEPAPPAETLRRAFGAAVAAPDHGRLRPWRFIPIAGETRAALGAAMAAALQHRAPGASETQLERERAKPLRAPLVIVVAAKLTLRPGIPDVEQIVAVGAATQNLSLALHAEGFATNWRTGEAAYDPSVKAALGLAADDAIVAFLYVGTPVPPTAARRTRPDPGDYVRMWGGAAA